MGLYSKQQKKTERTDKMKVLSLFDGMSCGRIALAAAGIPVTRYYASEVDKHAIKVSSANWPDIEHLGDVRQWQAWDLDFANIDLVLAGSPCQGFSRAGRERGFVDARSALFFDFVDILNHIRERNTGVKFLFENVRMKAAWRDEISARLGVAPVRINSALVSAQNRTRDYWANWTINQPADTGVVCADIIDHSDTRVNNSRWGQWWARTGEKRLQKRYSAIINTRAKSICLLARQVGSWDGNLVEHANGLRFISPLEAERLQTVPDNYTSAASTAQRYKMLGLGWTAGVIKHAFEELNKTP